MNSGHIREGELKEEFNALETAFEATGIDYYLIGALARDVWFARGKKKFTATRDVDFAVLVAGDKNYRQLKDYLKVHYQYTESGGNDFVMISPGKKQIDLLPFTEIVGNEGLIVGGNIWCSPILGQEVGSIKIVSVLREWVIPSAFGHRCLLPESPIPEAQAPGWGQAASFL